MAASSSRRVAFDFNGDGRSDILWRNNSTGANVIWRSASSATPQSVTGVTNLAWIVAGSGDYNGDGRSDLYAINTLDNSGHNTAVHIYDAATGMTTFLAQTRLPIGAAPLTQWQFLTGDYNGDHRSDLYLVNTQDNSGHNTAVHVLDAASGLTTFALHRQLPALPGTSLTVWDYTTADTDGDGRSDLIGLNTQDGSGSTALHVWSAASAMATITTNAVTALGHASLTQWQFHGWTAVGPCGSAPGAGTAVTRWNPVVSCVLGMLGLPASTELVDDVDIVIAGESGGDPNAINLTDINAQNGTPSEGLVQVIQPTFDAWRSPLLPDDLYNPAANIYAGMNYGIHTYGSIPQIPGVASVNGGGPYLPY